VTSEEENGHGRTRRNNSLQRDNPWQMYLIILISEEMVTIIEKIFPPRSIIII